MLLFLVAAVSLLTQAYVFRDTPAHPADPCVADRSLCPEESLDSLVASRERTLESMRRIARARAVSGGDAPVPVTAAVADDASAPTAGLPVADLAGPADAARYPAGIPAE